MAAGVYLDDVLTACTGIVQALTQLTAWPAPPQPATGWTVLSRFLATMHEALPTDQYPAVLVVPDDSGEEPSGETFEAELDWKYKVYVVVVAKNERDMTSNRNLYLKARQMIRNSALAGALVPPPMLPGAPTVWDARMRPKTPFDRRLLRQYAAMASVFEYQSHEPRFNP